MRYRLCLLVVSISEFLYNYSIYIMFFQYIYCVGGGEDGLRLFKKLGREIVHLFLPKP